MTDATPQDPTTKTELTLNAVAQEFAAMAEFFRQRLLMRANEVDGLQIDGALKQQHIDQLSAAAVDLESRLNGLEQQITVEVSN